MNNEVVEFDSIGTENVDRPLAECDIWQQLWADKIDLDDLIEFYSNQQSSSTYYFV